MLEKLPPDHDSKEETYSVQYRHVVNRNFHTLPNVIVDGSYPGIPDIRWFLLEDKTRVDIPTPNVVFTFSPKRHELVLKSERLKKEAEEAKKKIDEATKLDENE